MRIACCLAVAFAVLAACGDNIHPQETPDAASTVDAPTGFVEATHQAAPQVQSGGGPVLASPKVQPIFFSTDSDAEATLEDLLHMMVGSTYWQAVGTEYGVGDLTVLPSIVSTDTPPTTDDDLQTWLGTQFPTPDPSTIYTVYLPMGVTLTEGNSASCTSFAGYHSETDAGMVYALIPRCTSNVFSGPLDVVTYATSHELLEASTDPHPFSDPAYTEIDQDHLAWGRTPGAELGDMCEYVDAAFQPLVGNYLVQRTWSNASAAAGHDPCVPVLAGPYNGAAPNLPDLTITTHGGQQVMTKGITANLNQPVDLEVDLFTDAPQPTLYTVAAYDAAQFNGSAPNFRFTWQKYFGTNGDKLNLTITRTVAGNGHTNEIVIFGQNGQGQTVSEWWAYVAGQ
ncbi:MAG TPA: hypothetical protein VMJ10_05405 [Kofleriaceae bacterium]|nr:hypothetical protein [Kofleriaceae bacterium]